MPVTSGQTSWNIKVTAVTVTNTSAQAIASNNSRSGIIFHNPSATASIALTPTSFGAAALNTAGSITIGPLGSITLTDVRNVDAWNAISSVASSPLTVFEF